MRKIFKIVKTIAKTIIIILAGISILVFVTMPFLHNCIDYMLAQWLWYPSCFIFIILLFIGSKEDVSFGDPAIDRVSSVGMWWLLPVLPSIFIFNYYEIDYFWHWVLFSYVFLLIPYSFYNLLVVGLSQNKGSEEKNKTVALNIIKYIALYWLFDLFYMSIFNDWIIFKFVFGGLAILLISFNLIDAFLHGIKSLRFFFALELILGLGLSGYLVFIIPNEKLQTIVLAIVSALMGGVFTLLGVAWTIKKGDNDRKADLHRIEAERKEEERKKVIPYIKLSNEYESHHAAIVSCIKSLDLNKKEDIQKIKDHIYFVIMINSFNIKNVSNTNIILNGIYLDDDYHPFDSKTLVECNSVQQVQFPLNHWYPFAKKIENITLIISDILDNKYSVSCKIHEHLDNSPMNNIINDSMKYTIYSYTYTIENVSLPKLLLEDKSYE